MKTKKVEIWCNGRFFEIAKNKEKAEMTIRRLKREEEYDRECGYLVPHYVYEIRSYSGNY